MKIHYFTFTARMVIVMLLAIVLLFKFLIKNPLALLLTFISSSIHFLDNSSPHYFRNYISNQLENALKNETTNIKFWRNVVDYTLYNSNMAVNQMNIAVEYNTTTSTIGYEQRFLNLRIYKKKIHSDVEKRSNLGVLVWFHGGGWVLGSLDAYDSVCAQFSITANLVVVSVEYSLAPERPFPAAIGDALIALTWVKDNIASFGGNPGSVFIGGDSAGGNIAASLMATLLDDTALTTLFPSSLVMMMPSHAVRTSIVKGLVLYYPSLDSCIDRSCWGSYSEYEHDFILPLARMAWFRRMYQNHYPLSESLQHVFAPLHTPPHLLRLFPETLILVGEKDVLRDESLAYASKLTDCGVSVRAKVYNSSLHAFLQADLYGSGEKSILFVAEQLNRILHTISNAEQQDCSVIA